MERTLEALQQAVARFIVDGNRNHEPLGIVTTERFVAIPAENVALDLNE
jgi:hypothetical protein